MAAQPSVGCRHHRASLVSYTLRRATAQQHDRVACVVAFGQHTEAGDWLKAAAIEVITEMEEAEGTINRAILS